MVKMMTEAAMRSAGGKVCDWIEYFCNVPEGMSIAAPVVLSPFQRDAIYKVYNNNGKATATIAVEAKADELTLDDGDEEALELAMKVARDSSPQRAQQIDQMLAERPRLTVAKFASFCCQVGHMRLEVSQPPPCHVNDPKDVAVEGEHDAAKMQRKMLRNKVSKYHPFPFEAIDAAFSQVPRASPLAVILYKLSRRGVDVTDELHRALGLDLGPARVNILSMTMDDEPPAGMSDDETKHWKMVQRLLGQLISAS
jgi:hypothetical protein